MAHLVFGIRSSVSIRYKHRPTIWKLMVTGGKHFLGRRTGNLKFPEGAAFSGSGTKRSKIHSSFLAKTSANIEADTLYKYVG